MNLMVHHALKDLRALRGPLALWLFVLLAFSSAQAFKIDRLVTSADRLETLLAVVYAVSLCLVVFGWVIAAMIVQADPLDNPSAFWLTRPLSPRALLAGKLALIVTLFLLLPVAAASVVAAANGAGGRVLLQFALERLAIYTALLLPVLVAASLAHNLARTMLVLTVGVLIYGVLHVTAMMPFAGVAREAGAQGSGLLLALVVSGIGSLALLAHQYLTRATRRTMWLAAATLALAVAAGDFWPWSLFPKWGEQPVDTRVFNPAAVRVSLDEEGLRRSPTASAPMRLVSSGRGVEWAASGPPEIDVHGVVRADGVPPGFVVRVLRGQGELRAGSLVTAGIEPAGLFTSDTPRFERAGAGDVKTAFEHVLQARIVNNAPFVDGNRVRLFDLPETTYLQNQGAPVSLRAALRMEARRVVTSDPIRLAPGAPARLAGQELGVIRVGSIEVGGRWFVVVREARPQVRLALERPLHVVIRNRRLRQAFFPRASQLITGQMGVLVSDVSVTRNVLSLPQTLVDIDTAWLADAELILAVIEPVGTFEKPLVLDNFTLPYARYWR